MQGRIFNSGLSLMLVVLLGAVACNARPPRASDNTFGENIQDTVALDNPTIVNLADSRPLSNQFSRTPEEISLALMELEILKQFANNNNMKPSPWDQFLHAPQEKRQIRYRQCYFNPISCFRK